MPESNSSDIILRPPEDFDIDYEDASAWVNSELNAEFEADNQRFLEMVEAEKQVVQPIYDRARELGLTPEPQALEQLKNPFGTDIERLRDDMEYLPDYAPLPSGLGVMRQAHHVAHRITRTAPYSTSSSHQKDGGTNKSSARKSDGRFGSLPSVTLSTNTDWASCTLGDWFTMQSSNIMVQPRCSLTMFNGVGFLKAMFFTTASVEVEVKLSTFNITQRKSWSSTSTFARLSASTPFGTGRLVGPRPYIKNGHGEAAKGDRLFVNVAVTGRATAFWGIAELVYFSILDEISITD